MIKKMFILLLGFFIGAFAILVLVGLALDKVNENTITFQTDSEWFSTCLGENYGELIFIFGSMDCEDLNLSSEEELLK